MESDPALGLWRQVLELGPALCGPPEVSGQAETLLISRMIRLVPEIEIWQTDTDQSLYHTEWFLEFIRDGQLKKLIPLEGPPLIASLCRRQDGAPLRTL